MFSRVPIAANAELGLVHIQPQMTTEGGHLQPLGDPWSVLDISSAPALGGFSFASVPWK